MHNTELPSVLMARIMSDPSESKELRRRNGRGESQESAAGASGREDCQEGSHRQCPSNMPGRSREGPAGLGEQWSLAKSSEWFQFNVQKYKELPLLGLNLGQYPYSSSMKEIT